MLALLVAGYYGSFASILGSNFSDLANSTNMEDMMGMAQEMANSIQASPALATIMILCSMGAIVVGVVLLVFAVKDSKWGTNKYGPSPKYK